MQNITNMWDTSVSTVIRPASRTAKRSTKSRLGVCVWGWCRGRMSARLWPLILIKVPRIAECVIKITRVPRERTGRSSLLLRGRKKLIVEVVIWSAYSMTSTYAMIVRRRNMTNTRVYLKISDYIYWILILFVVYPNMGSCMSFTYYYTYILLITLCI